MIEQNQILKRFRVTFKEGMNSLQFVEFVLTEDAAATVFMMTLKHEGDLPFFELKNKEGKVFLHVSNIDTIEMFAADEPNETARQG